ncbi:hypothetical protein I5G67_gp038 [Mycobacterium phage Aminay]|uniref:Uncharacterized protein n=1 Tax=Mycobacterium phage Aminay TaxID=2250291 RepID=A0A345KV24_9CAUD|nr:hypothetical protein I5G67_gp038 [Mycobacterium phage Aminay]AXH46876.1 hypothetical protein SEA_AMINAY_38 [Mycobacterium phage Aminay]
MTAGDGIRAAIEAMLDESGDGYQLGQLVIVMSLEHINADGQIETVPWLWAPPDQAEWMTDGLLSTALDLRATADEHYD